MGKSKKRDLSYYRGLPYRRRVDLAVENGEEFFIASVLELPGLKADGRDHVEALKNLAEAFDDYIQAMLEWGTEIPEPELWPGSDYTPPAPRKGRRSRRPEAADKWQDLESGSLGGASASQRDLQPV